MLCSVWCFRFFIPSMPTSFSICIYDARDATRHNQTGILCKAIMNVICHFSEKGKHETTEKREHIFAIANRKKRNSLCIFIPFLSSRLHFGRCYSIQWFFFIIQFLKLSCALRSRTVFTLLESIKKNSNEINFYF